MAIPLRKLKPTPGGRSQKNISDDENKEVNDANIQANEGVRGIRSRFESLSGTRSVSPQPTKVAPLRLEKRVWNSKYGASLVKSSVEGGGVDKSQQEKEPVESRTHEMIDTSSSKRPGKSKPKPWEPKPGSDDSVTLTKDEERSLRSNAVADSMKTEEVQSEKKSIAVFRHSGINSIRSRFEALSNAKHIATTQEERTRLKKDELKQNDESSQESEESKSKKTDTRQNDINTDNNLKDDEVSQNVDPSQGNEQLEILSTGLTEGNEEAVKAERQVNVKRFQNFEKVDIKEREDHHEKTKSAEAPRTNTSSSVRGNQIGHVKNSAFEHIQKTFGGGKSTTTSLYPVNSVSVNECADEKVKGGDPEVELTTFTARRSSRTGQDVPDPTSHPDSNDIPWEERAPNDIPWNRNANDKQAVVTTPKPAVDMTYGVEYLDCSYDDDDCDGVTLSPTPSDVSSLSIPTCLQSIETSVVSESTATSDGDTGTMESATEKQSTTLGPSEASSSQTSEAATPLIASTLGTINMKFGLMTSSDTTGPSLSTNHYTDLLGTLPPPIDDPTDCKDLIDDNSFQPAVERKKSFGSNNQFEDQLNIQSIPKWKNDFFAVDSVKSCPTTESLEASNWVAFPEDAMSSEFHFSKPPKENSRMEKSIQSDSMHRGRKKVSHVHDDDNLKSLPTNSRMNNGESKRPQGGRKSVKNKKYNLDSVQELRKEASNRKTTKSTSPLHSEAICSSESPLVPTGSNLENEAPIATNQNNVKKRAKNSAYRRFNIQKVREFRRGRSSTKR